MANNIGQPIEAYKRNVNNLFPGSGIGLTAEGDSKVASGVNQCVAKGLTKSPFIKRYFLNSKIGARYHISNNTAKIKAKDIMSDCL